MKLTKIKNYIVTLGVVGVFFLAKFMVGETVEKILGNVETPQEIELDKLYNTKEKYDAWEENRKKEKEEGGCLYKKEDMLPDLNKPKEWEDFFIIKDVPKGFFLEEVYFQQQKDNWTITYVFHNKNENEKVFFFTQTKDKLDNDNLEKKGTVKKQGDYYVIYDKNRNHIYYEKNDFVLRLEGNINAVELMSIMNQVDSYKNVELYY